MHHIVGETKLKMGGGWGWYGTMIKGKPNNKVVNSQRWKQRQNKRIKRWNQGQKKRMKGRMNVYSNDIYTNLLTQGRGFNKKKCHYPNLGFATKARAWKGVGWKCNLGVTFTISRVRESVKE
jgi:hypothetical protein